MFQKIDWRMVSVGVALVALTLIVVLVWNLHRQGYTGTTNVSGTATTIALDEPSLFRHPLTGLLVDQPVTEPAVYAVMVENSADVWPQSGLDKAFEIIEAPAEGGIPRFLALFSADTKVEKIGPVRSARPYFIDWASAYGALYVHVGGSPAAIKQLNSTETVLDFDEYYNQYQFWRSADRAMPHNVYTSTELLGKGLTNRYQDKSDWTYAAATFKDDLALEARSENVADVVVEMGVNLYRVIWKYDRLTNSYQRFENTWAHTMADGTQLTANNIVVMKTQMTVLDKIGRLAIVTTGEGKGLLVQDGVIKNITWKKPTVMDLLRFYNADGTEVSLNPGQTWIEVVENL